MLVKALGIIDVLAGLILLFGTGLVGLKVSSTFLLVLGIILMAKSLLGLLKDFASWIDFVCGGVLILASLFTLPVIICTICAAFILQKGIFSFL